MIPRDYITQWRERVPLPFAWLPLHFYREYE